MAKVDSISAAVEDYAKAIYALQTQGEGPVSNNALAERLRVSAASASAMVKKLGGLGLVEHVPYRGVELSPEGRRVALEVLRHHRLLELYLAQSLGVPWDRVHDEAEVLEHHISEELEELIAEKLGIPTRDLELIEDIAATLDTLEPGARGRFTRISDHDPEMLRYLAERGIAPGDDFEVVDKQPFGGPLFVRFGAGDVYVIGGQLGAAMRVDEAGA